MSEADQAPVHLDVLVVGAGLSGVAAGHFLRVECPWASYSIFEARGDLGGTWDLFRYPGIRSDSDMYTLGYSFKPWDGRDAIADGEEILRYIREVADQEGISHHIRFGHRVQKAEWSSASSRWVVTATDPTGAPVTVTCGFLIGCTGYYRYDHGHEPHFDGAEEFAGVIVHPQQWPADLDVAHQRVVVIGSGATAVTLVPALAEQATHVTMLQRSPTYIASVPRRSQVARVFNRVLPQRPAGWLIRWWKALASQLQYRIARLYPAWTKRLLRTALDNELPADFDIDRHFTPSYDPWDQRLCAVPDGDLFKALNSGSASVVTDQIDRFTPTGIRLRSGDELPADIIVTATGLDLLFLGGIELVVDDQAVDPASKLMYKSMMLEGVPNLAVAMGYTNASWTLKCELTLQFVCRLLNHQRQHGLARATAINRDPTTVGEPMLGLSSGYIRRGVGLFPVQGSRGPWRVHDRYLRDYFDLRASRIEDGVLVLSGSSADAPTARRTPVRPTPGPR